MLPGAHQADHLIVDLGPGQGQEFHAPAAGECGELRHADEDSRAVLLAGIEREPAHDGKEIVLTPFRQTWWCVPS